MDIKTGSIILAEAIVDMYHLSRHNRDEVLVLVEKHWPSEELNMQADTILEQRKEIEQLKTNNKSKQTRINNLNKWKMDHIRAWKVT